MLANITTNLWIDLEDISYFRLNYIENEFEIKLKSDPNFKLKDKEEARGVMFAWENYKAHKEFMDNTQQKMMWKLQQLPDAIR